MKTLAKSIVVLASSRLLYRVMKMQFTLIYAQLHLSVVYSVGLITSELRFQIARPSIVMVRLLLGAFYFSGILRSTFSSSRGGDELTESHVPSIAAVHLQNFQFCLTAMAGSKFHTR